MTTKQPLKQRHAKSTIRRMVYEGVGSEKNPIYMLDTVEKIVSQYTTFEPLLKFVIATGKDNISNFREILNAYNKANPMNTDCPQIIKKFLKIKLPNGDSLNGNQLYNILMFIKLITSYSLNSNLLPLFADNDIIKYFSENTENIEKVDKLLELLPPKDYRINLSNDYALFMLLDMIIFTVTLSKIDSEQFIHNLSSIYDTRGEQILINGKKSNLLCKLIDIMHAKHYSDIKHELNLVDIEDPNRISETIFAMKFKKYAQIKPMTKSNNKSYRITKTDPLKHKPSQSRRNPLMTYSSEEEKDE